jgi:CRP-like cAMP-binding protein
MKRAEEPTLTRCFKKDSTIFREGKPCKGVYVLLRGRVARSISFPSNRSIEVVKQKGGDVLGLVECCGSSPHQTTATAVTNVTAHFIPKEDVFSLMCEQSDTSWAVLSMLSRELTQLHTKIRSLRTNRRSKRRVTGKEND